MLSEYRAATTLPESDRDRAPWGLGVGVSALAISFVVAVIGAGVTVHATAHLPVLLSDILAYQFLAVGVGISVVALILPRHGSHLAVLGFRFPGWDALLKAAVLVVPLMVGVALLTLLFNALLPGFHIQGNAKQELMPGLHKPVPLAEEVIVFLWAAVEAPLIEETLFRGILYQGLRTFFGRWMALPWAVLCAALVSGFTFGFVHGQPHTLPILFFMGVVLAYVFQYTRSVYASAVLHGITNAIAVVSVFQLG